MSNVTDAFNFSVTQSLSWIDFPTCFPNISVQLSYFFYLFLISSPDFCWASPLCSLGNPGHAVVPIDIFFESCIKNEPSIHKTSFCYRCTDWDSFNDLLRDTPLTEILNFPIENYTRNVSAWVKSGIDLFLCHLSNHNFILGSHLPIQPR